MALTEQLRAIARFEYALVRAALTTVDRTVLTPLADRSPGAERVVSRARHAAGDLDERLSPLAGAQRRTTFTPSDARDDRPTQRPRPSPQTPSAGSEPVAERPGEPVDGAGSAVLSADEVAEVEDLAEEYLEAEADHVTGELAENEELRDVQARLRAKHTLQEQDEQHH